MSSRSSDPDRLRDKAEIKRLVTEAQKSLKRFTIPLLADAIDMESGALYQAMKRGSLAGRHRRALQEVIATGQPVPKSLRSDELNALRAQLEESYAGLGLRGRAQFTVDFVTWLEARLPVLRRLDRQHIKIIEGQGGKKA